MKIEVNSPSINLVTADTSSKKVSNGSLAGTQGATVDRTTFSTDTQSVQALTSQAMSSPEVRQDKVEALSQSVSSGEYKPDASKLPIPLSPAKANKWNSAACVRSCWPRGRIWPEGLTDERRSTRDARSDRRRLPASVAGIGRRTLCCHRCHRRQCNARISKERCAAGNALCQSGKHGGARQ